MDQSKAAIRSVKAGFGLLFCFCVIPCQTNFPANPAILRRASEIGIDMFGIKDQTQQLWDKVHAEANARTGNQLTSGRLTGSAENVLPAASLSDIQRLRTANRKQGSSFSVRKALPVARKSNFRDRPSLLRASHRLHEKAKRSGLPVSMLP